MASDTFELTIRPSDSTLKSKVVAWLETHNYENIAYGVVDGIDDPLADLDDYVTFADDATPLAVYFDQEQDAEHLIATLTSLFGSSIACRLNRLSNEAWLEAWDESATPLETALFAVLSDPISPPDQVLAGRIPLVILPGKAFGDGRHATTKVALEMLECLPRFTSTTASPGCLLDIGTGNGILAIAAAQMGYRVLVGTDIDADALAEARRNAEVNGVTLSLFECSEPPDDGRLYDLVTVNILAPVLHELMPLLARRLAPRGRLLLAGFTEKDEPMLVRKAAQFGLSVHARRECRGWVGLLLGLEQRP